MLKIDGVTARTPLVATVDSCVIIDEGRQPTTTLLIRVFQHVKYKIVTLHVTTPSSTFTNRPTPSWQSGRNATCFTASYQGPAFYNLPSLLHHKLERWFAHHEESVNS